MNIYINKNIKVTQVFTLQTSTFLIIINDLKSTQVNLLLKIQNLFFEYPINPVGTNLS